MDPLMTIWVFLIGTIIGILIGVILSYRTAVSPLHRTVERLASQHDTLQEKLKYYPFDPDGFRFIGSPVDGIQFEQDAILFVRFKTGNTHWTSEQDHIKKLVEQRNVRWFEFTIG